MNALDRLAQRWGRRHPRAALMVGVVGLGAIAVWAAVRISHLPDRPFVIVSVVMGAAVGLGIAAVAAAVDDVVLSLPARVLGAAMIPSLVVLALAAGSFVGCSGARSCVRPIPQSVFPDWVRALSAGIVGAAMLALAIMLLYMAITRKGIGDASRVDAPEP